MKLSASAILFVSTLLGPTTMAQETVEDWSVHESRLPEPLSDHTATLDPTSGLIYLMGGCNAKSGNSLIPNTTDFGCFSVTNAVHSFDTATGQIDTTVVPHAPRPRYRHAAAFVQDHIWLVGGRDLEDNLVSQVDVYSTLQGKWLDNINDLVIPSELLTSDVTAFATQEGLMYVVGGYLAEYEAVKTMYAIDAQASLESGTLMWEKRPELNQARGDAHAAYVEETNTAYMMGGFTHLDGYCEALSSVERYDFKADKWVLAEPLTYERADKAVAVVGSRLFAIGGEANTDCALVPSQRTSPTTEVEVLDTSDGEDAKWTEEVADIPDDHFRFPAVSFKDTIYTFGGQAYYQSECKCFPTRDTIFFYRMVERKKLGAGPIAGVAIAAVAIIAGIMVIGKMKAGNKERVTEVEVTEQEMKSGTTLN